MDEGEAALPAVGDPKTISHKQAEQQGIPHEVGVEYLKEGRVVDGTDHATEPFEQVLQGEGIGHPGEIVREDADEQHEMEVVVGDDGVGVDGVERYFRRGPTDADPDRTQYPRASLRLPGCHGRLPDRARTGCGCGATAGKNFESKGGILP